MKVLCIGDPHIKVDNIAETDEMIEKLRELCLKVQPDIVVCMGDVLDRHATVHVQCLMMAEKMVETLSQNNPFYLIVGNHDRPNNSNFLTNEHPFNSMKKWKNVVVVDDVISAQGFLFVPYVPNQRFREALERVTPLDELNKYRAIFCHQEFLGAKMGSIISEHGDEWSSTSSNSNNKNVLTISGHIHDYDNLKSHIFYVGTPRQQTFSESPDKMISVFTFEKGENEENEENEKNEYRHERFDLGLKKKITLHLTPQELPDFNAPTDKHVKLVIHGSEAAIKVIAKTQKVVELKKAGVKVCFKTVQKEVEASIPDHASSKITYLDRLHREVSRDLRMSSWYRRLFLT